MMIIGYIKLRKAYGKNFLDVQYKEYVIFTRIADF